MTWLSPALVRNEDRFGGMSSGGGISWPAAGSLGSSIAGAWRWDSAPARQERDSDRQKAPPRQEVVRLRAPSETLRRMTEAARALGRTESDVWTEAAREWLQRHGPGGHDEGHELYAVVAPPDSAARRRAREWRAIDAVLDTLRDDTTLPEPKPSAA